MARCVAVPGLQRAVFLPGAARLKRQARRFATASHQKGIALYRQRTEVAPGPLCNIAQAPEKNAGAFGLWAWAMLRLREGLQLFANLANSQTPLLVLVG